MSTEKEPSLDNVLMATMFGVICVLGIIGNAIVLYATVKRIQFRGGQQTVPNILVFNLSVVDLLFLLGMPFLIHQLVAGTAPGASVAPCAR